MKITRDKMFFSKDLIHTLAYVGMFVAAIISVGACKSGIWVAAILAWIVAGIIIGLAIISDYKKAELLKNGTRIIGKVTATKRVHIKFHMSTYHLADEDVIYPYVVHTVSIPQLARTIPLKGLNLSLEKYRMPDGVIIEVESSSHYLGSFSEKNDSSTNWIEKIMEGVGIH